jgi:hypothetical protein
MLFAPLLGQFEFLVRDTNNQIQTDPLPFQRPLATPAAACENQTS